MSGTLESETAARGLAVIGALHPTPDAPELPAKTGTLVLLGPGEPGFWARMSALPEFQDGVPDPLDRWSRRTIGELAERFGGTALFPFGGPPWLPFLDWAQSCGTIWVSPVGLLVHETAGLMVSIRGALALPQRLELPEAATRPCDTCADKPCLSACPAGAMGPNPYDTTACRAWLDRPESDCMALGCAVRRACPVSQAYPRDPAQSAFHMRAFHPTER